MERVRKNGTRGKAAHAGRRLKRGSRREVGREGGREGRKALSSLIRK